MNGSGPEWDHYTPWASCPFCGTEHDGAANMVGVRQPREGDAALCAECGNWAIFTAELQRRRPDEGELKILTTGRQFRQIRAEWLHLQALRRSGTN